eukprot:754292-Prymnesium_polylepis.1
MGLDPRCGIASPVRLLVGHGEQDLLRLIFKEAGLRTSDWLAQPLPKEVPTLRRHLRLEHGERRLAEDLLDEARVHMDALRTELARAIRRAESAAQAAVRLRAQFDEFQQQVRDDAQQWKEQVEQRCNAALKDLRQRHATEMRSQSRELTDRWMGEREQRLELDALRVRQAEDREGDRREDLARYRAREQEAAQGRAEFERRFEEAQQAAMRLRSARNQSALQRQAALEEENRRLKQRRTLNQRRQSEAALDRRRVDVAQQQQAAAQAALAEYCIDDEAQRERAAQAAEAERDAAEARAKHEALLEQARHRPL